jgi:hypothetical protein
LKWNQNFRVVGFFGAPHRLDEIEKLVPTLEFTTAPTGGANCISYRADTQLAENEHSLFDLPAGFVVPPLPTPSDYSAELSSPLPRNHDWCAVLSEQQFAHIGVVTLGLRIHIANLERRRQIYSVSENESVLFRQ